MNRIKEFIKSYFHIFLFSGIIIFYIYSMVKDISKYNRCSLEYPAYYLDLGEYKDKNNNGDIITKYKPVYKIEINGKIKKFTEREGREYLPWGVSDIESQTFLRINPDNIDDWGNRDLLKRDIIASSIYLFIYCLLGGGTLFVMKRYEK